MNAVVQTAWVNPAQPTKPGRKTNRVVHHPVDPTAISICDDPLPAHRAKPGCKYETIFGAMKVGQAIKCPGADSNRVANALRKYIAEHRSLTGCKVRSISKYDDGQGRVWLLPPDKPATAKPSRVK